MVLDRADDDSAPGFIGRAPGEVDALDREVVRLGAASGEDHLGRPRAYRRGKPFAGLFNHAPRLTPSRMQGRGVADLGHRGRHRGDDLPQHGGGGGVIEIGHRWPVYGAPRLGWIIATSPTAPPTYRSRRVRPIASTPIVAIA